MGPGCVKTPKLRFQIESSSRLRQPPSFYAIGFVEGMIVPKAIDTGAVVPVAEALIVNILLMSLFAVPHSVMARRQFKDWWTQFVPRPVERSTYVLLAGLALALLFWQWRPMPTVVWQVANPGRSSTRSCLGLGYACQQQTALARA
jgi:protein-S-isoprenylcysteine O-methyltransferase Ste14